MAFQSIEPVSRFSRGQPDVRVYALGKSDTQCLRLAEAMLLARRRRLCAKFSRADERDELAGVRHGTQSEVRRLHGALRVRTDGGRRYGRAPVESARRRVAWTTHNR